jgi:hypothetical protein
MTSAIAVAMQLCRTFVLQERDVPRVFWVPRLLSQMAGPLPLVGFRV